MILQIARNAPLLSLLMVPAVAGWWGVPWYWTRAHEVREVEVAAPDDPIGGGRQAILERGRDSVHLAAGQVLRAALPRLRVAGITLLADGEEEYEILLGEDELARQTAWVAPILGGGAMRTRSSPPLAVGPPARLIAVMPRPGELAHAIAALRLEVVERQISPLLLFTGLFWASWLALLTWARHRDSGAAATALRLWRDYDHWIAALAVTVILFRFDSSLAVRASAVAVLGIAGVLLRAVVRQAPAKIGLAVLSTLVTVAVAEAVATRLFEARLGRSFDTTVDHRMRPDGAEINSDGIRFRGEHTDVDAADFNVVFLGDSFTYGVGADYPAIYPFAFEDHLKSLGCEVRAINFGWISSSPLLSLRLLRDIGALYKPDLVIYNLDVTDFQDDLRYAAALQESGEVAYEPRFDRLWVYVFRSTVVGQALRRLEDAVSIALRRRLEPDAARESFSSMPKKNFFVVQQPLSLSRPYIESGVVKNLDEIHRFTTAQLGATFVLAVLPRAFQYSRDESPDNWERHEYDPLGPYVLEPFRYFEEAAPRLRYPVVSLLEPFRSSDRFPLFKVDDPHWNAAGNEVAARGLATELLSRKLLPGCG